MLFVAPYQGCHVAEQVIHNESMTLTKHTPLYLVEFEPSGLLFQQGGNHVLHLMLWGESMTMSCPPASPRPSVTCLRNGMVLNMGNIAAEALFVKGTFQQFLMRSF